MLFALDSTARASVVTVLYLQAKDLGFTDRHVTLLTNAASLSSLVFSFLAPMLVMRYRRRWVYVGGVCLLIATAALLSTGTLAGQASAMLCRSFGAAALNITLSLYVMDYIRKRDLVRSEPLRLMFSSIAWGAGPLLGVALQNRFGQGAAELVS
ncbi:MAG: MFS transporter, partial [Dongia sp.]